VSTELSDRGPFGRAILAIDAANGEDPNTIVVRGEVQPKELAHAALMSEWVARLDPEATDAQLLAARAHHLRRWAVPRGDYPEGRKGYLRWRTDLRKRHAADVAALLHDVGYDDETVERVRQIVNKEGLGTDPAVQAHEDALCLVFLETQLADLTDRLGDDKMLDVIAKTAAKMSPAALGLIDELPIRASDRALIARATSG
jgi:hypothetical protein